MCMAWSGDHASGAVLEGDTALAVVVGWECSQGFALQWGEEGIMLVSLHRAPEEEGWGGIVLMPLYEGEWCLHGGVPKGVACVVQQERGVVHAAQWPVAQLVQPRRA